MNNKFSTSPDTKDFRRITDIVSKADGRTYKERALAEQMANSITDYAKCTRRAKAATQLSQHEIAAFFYVRIGQLRGR